MWYGDDGDQAACVRRRAVSQRRSVRLRVCRLVSAGRREDIEQAPADSVPYDLACPGWITGWPAGRQEMACRGRVSAVRYRHDRLRDSSPFQTIAARFWSA